MIQKSFSRRVVIMSFVLQSCAVILLVFALGQEYLASADGEEVESWLVYIQNNQTGSFKCPKTSPDEHVRLYIDGDFEIELSDRVSYNPAEGFEIKNFTYLDTGLYKCTIEKNNKTRTLREFDVNVLRPPRRLEYPEIDEYKLRHVIEGKNLRVNCTMEASRIHWITIHWIIPQEEDDRITYTRYEEFKPQRRIQTEELQIQNVSSADAGIYRCRSGIIGSNRIEDVTTTITVLANPAMS